jgi:hypothetical protein
MRKGQSLIFEQVLLFMISVAIFIVCFGLFQLYQSHFTHISLNDQVKAVRDMVSSQVLQIVKFENLNVTSKLKIPKKISGEEYRLLMTGTGLNVTTEITGITATSNFYQLGERYSFSGETISSKGEIIIYKMGNNIIIE